MAATWTKRLVLLTAAVGAVWALWLVALAAYRMYGEWSAYEFVASTLHAGPGAFHRGLAGSSLLPVGGALTVILWYPLTALWAGLSIAVFLTCREVRGRVGYLAASLTTVAVTAVLLGAQTRASTIAPLAPLRSPLHTARFDYWLLLALLGLSALVTSIWFTTKTTSEIDE